MVKSYRPGSAGMVPATPGTYLVQVYFDDDQVDIVRSSVIGWQVSSERVITPLVIDPRAAEEDPWYVIHPDGRVECSDGRCWRDSDTWVTEERRLLQTIRERRELREQEEQERREAAGEDKLAKGRERAQETPDRPALPQEYRPPEAMPPTQQMPESLRDPRALPHKRNAA